MKWLLALPLFMLACGGIQTEPTCKVKQFGRLVVSNSTDDYKTVKVWRLVRKDDKLKRVGEPITRQFEPMVEGRLRVSPGYIMIAIGPHQGVTSGISPCGNNVCGVYLMNLCGIIRIHLGGEVILKDLDIPLQSRRSLSCPPCDCQIMPWPKPLVPRREN